MRTASLGNPFQCFTALIVLFSFYLMANLDCSCWSLVLIPCIVKCIAFWIWFAWIPSAAKPKYHMSLWKVANAFTFSVNQIFEKKKTLLVAYRKFKVRWDVCKEICFQPFHPPEKSQTYNQLCRSWTVHNLRMGRCLPAFSPTLNVGRAQTENVFHIYNHSLEKKAIAPFIVTKQKCKLLQLLYILVSNLMSCWKM